MKQQDDRLHERLEQAHQENHENRGGDRRIENEGELRIYGIGLNIPTFKEKSDPEVYLE